MTSVHTINQQPSRGQEKEHSIAFPLGISFVFEFIACSSPWVLFIYFFLVHGDIKQNRIILHVIDIQSVKTEKHAMNKAKNKSHTMGTKADILGANITPSQTRGVGAS